MGLHIAHWTVVVLAMLATIGTCFANLLNGTFEVACELLWERRYELALYAVLLVLAMPRRPAR
jgi:hypothetical protein